MCVHLCLRACKCTSYAQASTEVKRGCLITLELEFLVV